MDRRRFIQTSAAATVAGAAVTTGTSCGLTPNDAFPMGGAIDLPNMDSYLRELDEGMSQIASWDFAGKLPDCAADQDEHLDLARRSLGALYLTAMFSDQSEVGQAHPGLQKRVIDAEAEIDRTIADMEEFLRTRTSSELAEIQLALNDEPDLPMEIAEMLNVYGKEFGLKSGRRLQVRNMVGQTARRMRAQSPGLIVSEYVTKVDKLVKKSGSEEEIKQQIVARLGEEEFVAKQQRMAMYARAWEAEGARATAAEQGGGTAENTKGQGEETSASAADVGTVDGGVAAEAPQSVAPSTQDVVDSGAPEPILVIDPREPNIDGLDKTCLEDREPSERLKRGKKLMKSGTWTLGVGVLIGLFGVALIPATFIAASVMWTVGGILLIVGLIILIVGAVKKRRAERALEASC